MTSQPTINSIMALAHDGGMARLGSILHMSSSATSLRSLKQGREKKERNVVDRNLSVIDVFIGEARSFVVISICMLAKYLYLCRYLYTHVGKRSGTRQVRSAKDEKERKRKRSNLFYCVASTCVTFAATELIRKFIERNDVRQS